MLTLILINMWRVNVVQNNMQYICFISIDLLLKIYKYILKKVI